MPYHATPQPRRCWVLDLSLCNTAGDANTHTLNMDASDPSEHELLSTETNCPHQHGARLRLNAHAAFALCTAEDNLCTAAAQLSAQWRHGSSACLFRTNSNTAAIPKWATSHSTGYCQQMQEASQSRIHTVVQECWAGTGMHQFQIQDSHMCTDL
eukprot:jgi/Ulvmu1/9409/UM051_0037.1